MKSVAVSIFYSKDNKTSQVADKHFWHYCKSKIGYIIYWNTKYNIEILIDSIFFVSAFRIEELLGWRSEIILVQGNVCWTQSGSSCNDHPCGDAMHGTK